MTIPYIEERKKLLALYEQRDAVGREEDEALAPLLAQFEALERRAAEEFLAAGGHKAQKITIDIIKDPTQSRLRDEYEAKIGPQRSAIRAAREVFEERRAEVQDQIDAIEQEIGAKILDDSFMDAEETSGAPLQCGLTGVLLLSTDKVVPVLASALPKSTA